MAPCRRAGSPPRRYGASSTPPPGPSSSMIRTAAGVDRCSRQLDGGLGGLDRQLVHHLHGGRHDPGADDGASAAPAASIGREVGEQRCTLARLGSRSQSHRHLGGDAERALGPDEHAEQVVAGRVGCARRRAGPVRRRRAPPRAPSDVVGGEAVLEAVGAAGVLGDVAADGADLLAGRVGRVVVARAARRRWSRARLITPGSTTARSVVGVDLEDPPHPRGRR